MKKILKTIIVSLLIFLIIAFAGVFIFLKTFDFNRFKPQIIAAAEGALGRRVDFSRIGLGLTFGGVQLSLADIVVGEDPGFAKGNFLTVKELKLDVSLSELIFKRQIQILGVVCKSPQINIIRLKDGNINVQAFAAIGAALPQTHESSDTQAGKPAGLDTKKSALAGLPVILINRIDIIDARISYIDYSFDPKLLLTLEQITLNIRNFSLKDSFPITLRASFLSSAQNISMNALGQLNLERASFLLKDLKATVELSTLSMDVLRRSLPQLESVSLPEFKSGELSVFIDLLEAGAKGLSTLKGRTILTKGSFKMKELAVPVDSIEAKITMSGSDIVLNDMSCSLGKGRIDFLGELKDYLLNQKYSAKGKAAGIDISECLDQSAYPVKVKGIISGEIEVNGQGLDPKIALTNLTGSGFAQIKEGRLVDINVLRKVLDKLSLVPNLAAALETGLPERYRESLSAKDTVITACNAELGIKNSTVEIKSMNAETEVFKFQGSGVAGFDQSYSFGGAFTIQKDLSSLMVEAVSEMGYLLDEQSQIRFPLKVSGKGAEVSFMPDIKQMGTTAIINRGRQELEKVLDKALGGKGSSEQGASQGTSAEPGTADEKSGKQELIESIIGTVFGGKDEGSER